MNVQINEYIDFGKLFNDLYSEQLEILEQHKFEADHYKQILDFKQYHFSEFTLQVDECDYDSKRIFFVFGMSFNDANESDSQSTTADCCIIYDCILDEFTSYEYEQG